MRPLALLSFAALAVAASVQRRQGQVVSIDSVVASGSFCGPDAVGVLVPDSGDVVQVGFRESRLLSPPSGPTSGDCTLEVSMTYPPGCTSAAIEIGVHVFLEGLEGVTGSLDVAASLSAGGQTTESAVYQNDEGEDLETGQQVYTDVWPIDASASVDGDEAAEVVLTIQLDSRIESADGATGGFILDDLAVTLTESSLDTTGESCV